MDESVKTEGRHAQGLSEMRQRVAELEELEKKYRTLVDNALVGIYKTNLRGDILYINASLARILEYDSPEEMMAGNILAVYRDPKDRDSLIRKVKKYGKVDNFEAGLYTKRGLFRKVLISATMEGDVLSGMVIDITKLRRAKEALRESEQKYRDLYDNAPDMYHSLNKDGIIIDCNETEAKTLGYKKEDIIGRHFGDFLTKESKILFEKNFPRLNRERAKLTVERDMVKKDGTVIPVSLHVFNEFDEKGEFKGTRTIARDISERRKMEEELLKIQKLESISLLAGGIAHDFNNLLTAIFGNIAMAKLYARPGDNIYDRLEEAERASLRAKDLTFQLLTFSKGGEPVKKTASIAKLIRESVGFILSGSNVKSEFHIADDLWPADVDEGQITQVVNNLVINAEQAMPEGGIISVYCENITIKGENSLSLKDGAYVSISIEDRGSGIPRELLQKIFDPYFTTKQKGNGLGLAVAYSITNKHNGCITVKSCLGAGTTFKVYLPASSEKITDKADTSEKHIAGSGMILVMDDEEMVRNLAGDMLSHMGYDVEFAENGAEAVSLYEKAISSDRPFDAVVLDLTVPGGMGGMETIKKLLEIDSGVRAIVSSGYSNDPVMADFKKYGFSDIVAKPYKIGELGAVLQRVITGADK